MGTYIGETTTGVKDPIKEVPLKNRIFALKAIGHDNTGNFTSATIELQVSLDTEDDPNIDYVTVATITLNNSEEADLVKYEGIATFVRVNITEISVSGDATLDVTLRAVDF